MSDLATALGRGKELTLMGRKYPAADSVLDLTDIADIETELGAEISTLVISKRAHMRLLVWAVARKSDQRRTDEQRARDEYVMSVREAGRLCPAGGLNDEEVRSFVLDVMEASGFISREQREGKEPVKPSAEGNETATNR